MSDENYQKLRTRISDAVHDYTEATGDMVHSVYIRKDEDEEYAMIQPVLGEPEYTDEARDELGM